MARVTYRGIPYDTNQNILKEYAYVKQNEVYRGVEHTETRKVEVRR